MTLVSRELPIANYELFKTMPQAFFVKLPKCLLKLFSSAYVQLCFVCLFLVLRADSQLVSVSSADISGAALTLSQRDAHR